jgi:hypothetical protein
LGNHETALKCTFPKLRNHKIALKCTFPRLGRYETDKIFIN